MQTATSETESKSHDLSICVHHYTLRAPCPKGQGNGDWVRPGLYRFLDVRAEACLSHSHPLCAGQQRVGRTTNKSH